MPPGGTRPARTRRPLTAWCSILETELDRAALAHPNPGRPRLQRLNRVEYKNAIRDLLALDIDVASMLPADIGRLRVRQQRRRADAFAGADGALS